MGECYNPAKLELSEHHLFGTFQQDILENSQHITEGTKDKKQKLHPLLKPWFEVGNIIVG